MFIQIIVTFLCIEIIEQLRAIYQLCKSTLGSVCSGTTDKYQQLTIYAAPTELPTQATNAAFLAYCVPDLCLYPSWAGRRAQVSVSYFLAYRVPDLCMNPSWAGRRA